MGSVSKLGILACLYFSQGLPYGFFTQALPVIMREQGASLQQIGLASLLVLPWALKFLWAPFVDRYGWRRIGQKKSWILLLQCLAVILLLSLGLVESKSYPYLMWGFFFANLIVATQDIASDGLAVIMLHPSERGVGNGLQIGGYRFGMIFGGGFILMAFSWLQWKGAFFTISVALALATVPVLFYSERNPSPPSSHPSAAAMLSGLMRRKGFLAWLLVIGFYKFGDAMASQMLRPFFIDRGLGLADIGKLLGTAGFISGLVGALAGGALVSLMGRYRAVVGFGVIQAGAVFTYYLLGTGILDDRFLYAVCAMEHFAGGLATAAIFTAMMDVCRPESASTDYTSQASFVVISTSSAGVVAGLVAQSFGHQVNFLVATFLSLAGAMVFAWKFKSKIKVSEPLRLA